MALVAKQALATVAACCLLMAGGARHAAAQGAALPTDPLAHGWMRPKEPGQTGPPGPPPSSTLLSENAAFNWSLYGTLLPTATLVLSPVGIILGPSTGYFYAGRPGRALLGIGIRAVSLIGGVSGAFAICGWDCSGGGAEGAAAWTVLILGSGTAVASAIYDIAGVKRTVRHENARRSAGVSVVPVLKSGRPGLGIRIAF